MGVLTLPLLFVLGLCVTVSRGFDITKILAQHPEFSTYNHYLNETHLASEINRRKTITVLVVSNDGMGSLLAKGLSIATLRHVFALHILVDYYGARKLHQLSGGSTLCSTVNQGYGVPGISGFLNMTMQKGGVVSIHPADCDTDTCTPVTYVKSIFEQPYELSVLQISSIIDSPIAEAPTEAPSTVNLTDLMSSKGCKSFADLLLSTADAAATFQNAIDGGLTVFCPLDEAVDAFLPKFKNLTDTGKLNLLLYHAVPVYYSVQLLRTSNGVMSTLATEKKNFNITVQNSGEVVTIKTLAGIVAKIVGTIKDEDPLAVYSIDKVLEPRELFKKEVLSPAPAPGPISKELAPKASKGKKKKPAEAPQPAAGPDAEPADQKGSDNYACRMVERGGLVASAMMAVLVNFVF